MQTLLNALTGSPGAMSRRTWRVRYLLDPELDEALQNAAEPKAHESKAERQKRMARRLSASLTKGQWFCEACDCWHEKPTRGRPACPNEHKRENEDAINSVERRLAYAFGQRGQVADRELFDLALDLECGRWGSAVRDRYRNHPQLSEYTTRAAEHFVALAANGKAPPHGVSLSEAQTKLVSDHLPLVTSLAWQFAPSNALLREDLETHGVERLTGLVRLYDAARGAMRERFGERVREIGVDDPEKIDAAMAVRTRKLPAKPKEDRPMQRSRTDELFTHDSAAAKGDLQLRGEANRRREELSNLTARYLAGGGAIKRRTPVLTEDLKGAIARLNRRQELVYRSRVLTDPPVPRGKIARELGIKDSTQISRILRQAEEKIAKMLKAKVSPA